MQPSSRESSGVLANAIRYSSFGLGLLASVCLMVFPFLLHHVPANKMHAGLPVIMLGVAGTFVHGVGYKPENRVLSILFAPAISWLIIVSGFLLLLH